MNVDTIIKIAEDKPELIDLILKDKNDKEKEISEQILAGLKEFGINQITISIHSFRIFVKNVVGKSQIKSPEDHEDHMDTVGCA